MFGGFSYHSEHIKYNSPNSETGFFQYLFILVFLSSDFVTFPLEKTSKVVDFELFRKTLEDGVLTKDKKNNAGAKPFDVVMMFKKVL